MKEVPILLIGDFNDRKTFLTKILDPEVIPREKRNYFIRAVVFNTPLSFISMDPPISNDKEFFTKAFHDSLGLVLCTGSKATRETIGEFPDLLKDAISTKKSIPILLAILPENDADLSRKAISDLIEELLSEIPETGISHLTLTPKMDATDQILSWIRTNIAFPTESDLIEILLVEILSNDKQPLASLKIANVDWPMPMESALNSRFALMKTQGGIMAVINRFGFYIVLLATERSNPNGLVVVGESLAWDVAQAASSGGEITAQTISESLSHSTHQRLSVDSMQPSRILLHQTWPSVKSQEVYESIRQDLRARGPVEAIKNLVELGRKLASRVSTTELNFLTAEGFVNTFKRGWAPMLAVDKEVQIQAGSVEEGRLVVTIEDCPFEGATVPYISRFGGKVPPWFSEITDQYMAIKDEGAVGPLCVLHQSYRAHLFDKMVVAGSPVIYRQIACQGAPGHYAVSPDALEFLDIDIDEIMKHNHCIYAIFFGSYTS
ncbi:MAG: hypothetical protein ACFFB3_13280 [Candidatus Hodarchaeota archaeon]